MKEQILKLRSEGKTYNQITDILGCAKSTVSYYCGNNQPEKSIKRNNINKLTGKYILSRKIDAYLGRIEKYGVIYIKRDILHKQIYDKCVNQPYCYLTGKEINFSNELEYSIDHIIPYSISKDNSFENAGLCCREVNQAKNNLTVENFIKLCENVVKYNNI